MKKLLRSEYGVLELICIVLDEHEHIEEFGRFPPNRRDMRPNEFRGSPPHRAKKLETVHRQSFWRWSKTLRRQCRRCGECNRPITKGGGIAPMLHDELWLKIAGKLDVLCDRCCRRRLGRPYTLRDLRICMFNIDNFRWLDGPPWGEAVQFEHMPDVFFGLPIEQQPAVVALVRGVSRFFGISMIDAAGILDITKRIAPEPFEDMQLIFMADSFRELVADGED